MKNIWLLILLVSILFSSCQKEKKEICQANCQEVQLSGRVYEFVSKTGVPKVTISVRTQNIGFCFGCITRLIDDIKTDSSGYYNLIMQVDSLEMSNGLRLELSNVNATYFFDSFTGNNTTIENSKNVGIDFPLYLKTKLDIKVVKTSKTPYQRLDVFYTFKKSTDNQLRGIAGNFEEGKDTTYHLETASDLYTQIRWRKTIDALNNKYEEHIDSIFCKKGELNTFNLKF